MSLRCRLGLHEHFMGRGKSHDETYLWCTACGVTWQFNTFPESGRFRRRDMRYGGI